VENELKKEILARKSILGDLNCWRGPLPLAKGLPKLWTLRPPKKKKLDKDDPVLLCPDHFYNVGWGKKLLIKVGTLVSSST